MSNSIVRAEDTDISYPIKNGIIDFLPDIADRISRSYDSAAGVYDDYQNMASLKWKLFILVVWGFLDDSEAFQRILSSIPEGFDGVLLDIPVGTGTHTVKKYRKLSKARIVAIDYSMGMLERARKRYAENGITNVTYIRGDVGHMPVRQASVDMCLSMAGFHAFPDKDQALSEIVRVLRAGAIFSGTTYIRGKRLLTDLVVKHVFCRKGYFTAPFFTEEEFLAKLGECFTARHTANVKSGFYFEVQKNRGH